MLMVVLAGPSGNRQSKLPPLVLTDSDPTTRLPPVPQSGKAGATVKVSAPGSVTLKLYDWVSPSLALIGPVRTTVGATFSTVNEKVAVDVREPSSAVMVTVPLSSGPSVVAHDQDQVPSTFLMM